MYVRQAWCNAVFLCTITPAVHYIRGACRAIHEGEQPAIFDEVAVKKSFQSKGSPPKNSNWLAWNSKAVPVTFGDLEGTPDDAAGALNRR